MTIALNISDPSHTVDVELKTMRACQTPMTETPSGGKKRGGLGDQQEPPAEP